jgi:hypothetical protein
VQRQLAASREELIARIHREALGHIIDLNTKRLLDAHARFVRDSSAAEGR